MAKSNAIKTIETVEQANAFAVEVAALEAVNNDDENKPKNLDIFAAKCSENAKRLETKLHYLGNATALLREAIASDREAVAAVDSKKVQEALTKTVEATNSLYFARCYGRASADEISAALISLYGAKPKSNGEPGKTPAGQGEHIRKRVVRGFAAYDFATTGKVDPGSYLDGCDIEKVIAVVDKVNMVDGVSLWSAYDEIGEIKKAATVNVDSAFDPAKIKKICAKLAEPGSAEIVRNSNALIECYAALTAILDGIRLIPND